MKTKTKSSVMLIALVLLAFQTVNHPFSIASAQTTAFTYQGQLQNNGSPVSGTYNMTFTLFNVSSGGTAVAVPVTTNGVIVANGLFTVPIDFGPGVFISQTNWLEIAVETNLASSFTTLTPRQELTPTPDAIYAENAADAAVLANGAAIGAGAGNSISSSGATDSFVGGGDANEIFYNSLDSVINGGSTNIIQHDAGWSVISGGENNQTASGWSVISGGNANVVGLNTVGSTIGGGYNNTNNGNYATVPGGNKNVAGGSYSFAAGNRAKALNSGAFVWADSQNADFASTANNQFSVRAQGGVQFVTSGAGVTVDGQPVAKSYGTPISSAPFTITKPGSYYLTTNLNVAAGDAIDINANGVTLDLNGFTIFSTDPNNTGTAINLTMTTGPNSTGNSDVTIVNGHITSGVTNNANTGIFNGPGFKNGIEYSANNTYGVLYNVRVTAVSVSGLLGNGIEVNNQGFSTLVESCTVFIVGGTGIVADCVSHCTANGCGGDGIDAETASDSAGSALSNGIGLQSTYTSNNCNGYSYGGKGLSATVANNCYGFTYSGTGLSVSGSANGCFGGASIIGVGINANIANSCTYTGSAIISHKYNMP